MSQLTLTVKVANSVLLQLFGPLASNNGSNFVLGWSYLLFCYDNWSNFSIKPVAAKLSNSGLLGLHRIKSF